MNIGNIKKYIGIAFATAAMLVAVGCGGSNQSASTEQAKTIVVKHAQGETTVPVNPKRVVTLDLAALDSLDVLGSSDVVVGIPKELLPTYLEKFKSDTYQDIGSIKDIDLEKIAKVNPDLIIINTRQAQYYKQLSEIAPTIDLTTDNMKYWASFEHNMNILGDVFNKQDAVKAQLDTLNKQVKDMQAKTEPLQKRGVVLMTNGGKLRTFGPGSRYGFVYDLSGAKSIVPPVAEGQDGKHGNNISFELLAQDNPQWMIVIDRDGAIGNGGAAQQLLNTELVNGTDAAKTNHIVYVDSSVWYLAYGGFQSTKIILDDIAKAIE